MIAFLWAYNVVVISFVLTSKIVAWLLRLFIIAPIQALLGSLLLFCTWLLYAAFAVAGVYVGLTVLVIVVVIVLAYFLSERAEQRRGRQVLDDSAHLFEFLASQGAGRAQVQDWIVSKSIRICNETTGKSFYPSSEVCRVWPGDVVMLRRRNIETRLEFEPKIKVLAATEIEARRLRWLAEQSAKEERFKEDERKRRGGKIQG